MYANLMRSGRSALGASQLGMDLNIGVTYLSSATLARSSGLLRSNTHVSRASARRRYIVDLFSKPSTEERMTGKVVAKCFREDTNARTVLRA